MRPVRILLVSDWMSHAGGSEVYIAGLKQWLREAGDDVRLVTCGVDGPSDADARTFGTDNVIAQAALQIVNPFAVAGVRRMVRDFKPDAALVNHFAFHLSPAVLAALRSVPTAVAVNDYKLVCPIGSKLLPDGSICDQPAGLVCWRSGCVSLPHWFRDQPRYSLLRTMLAKVRHVVAPSRWMQGELQRNGIASECIPIAVNAPPAEFRRAPAASPTFSCVGRLSREKGIDVLLHAFARLVTAHPTARLRLVGDGHLRGDMRHLVDTLGLTSHVEFTGLLPPSGVDATLQDAWALVAPSKWAEPFGLSVAEAIVRGVPVVTTALGGFADTVEEGVTGLVVPNGDVTRLATALDQVASKNAFPHQAISSAAVRELTERLSPRRYAERLHMLFGR